MFDQAIELKPSAHLHYARATAHRRLREYDKAIDDYDMALKIRPASGESPWMLYHRATLHWIVGDGEAALRDYDRFQSFHPTALWSDARRFCILAELGRQQEAQRHLEQVYAQVAENAWLARVLEYLLDRRSAESLLKLADTPEKKCEATYYIAERKLRQGDLEEARRYYEACLATGVDRFIIPGEVTPSSEYELSEWRLATVFAPR
jgi:lipoprotein NlpI